MSRSKARYQKNLPDKYPPSEPCGCEICLGYCARPGWWTVTEAEGAIAAGYGARMMLELAPERTFGVLSPAFKGCEGSFALQQYARRGCTFLHDGLCGLHGSGFQPLECRFCHHNRPGLGKRCHADLEQDWRTPRGQALVETWTHAHGLLVPAGMYFSRVLPSKHPQSPKPREK